MNADEYARRGQWTAMSFLAGHGLLGESYWDAGRGARWCIGRTDTFIHRCEIIAGIGGSLVVHGDFDIMRFAHYGDHGDAWSRLLWMADHRDLGYYVAQKASIGMARATDVYEYSADVARHDLERHIRDWVESECSPAAIEVLCGARRYTDEEHELRRFLQEHDKGWDFWEMTIGQVLRPSVITSHLALNKCAALLREKYGASGPPACNGH